MFLIKKLNTIAAIKLAEISLIKEEAVEKYGNLI